MAIEYKDKPKKSREDRFAEIGVKRALEIIEERKGLVSTSLPKPKMGRPRTGYIKAEYNRKYSADKRAAFKLGISVPEYRALHTPYPVDENTTTK